MTRFFAYRHEPPYWWNMILCCPFFIIGLVFYWILGAHLFEPLRLGITAAIIFPIPILLMCVFPKLYLKRWYIEFTKDGFTDRVVFRTRFYPWSSLVRVSSERSPEFTGRFHDTLLVETQETILTFFLPNYGLHQKREITAFIEGVKQLFEKHRK